MLLEYGFGIPFQVQKFSNDLGTVLPGARNWTTRVKRMYDEVGPVCRWQLMRTCDPSLECSQGGLGL